MHGMLRGLETIFANATQAVDSNGLLPPDFSPSPNSGHSSGENLSGGEIAGYVMIPIALLGLIAGACCYIRNCLPEANPQAEQPIPQLVVPLLEASVIGEPGKRNFERSAG